MKKVLICAKEESAWLIHEMSQKALDTKDGGEIIVSPSIVGVCQLACDAAFDYLILGQILRDEHRGTDVAAYVKSVHTNCKIALVTSMMPVSAEALIDRGILDAIFDKADAKFNCQALEAFIDGFLA